MPFNHPHPEPKNAATDPTEAGIVQIDKQIAVLVKAREGLVAQLDQQNEVEKRDNDRAEAINKRDKEREELLAKQRAGKK